jgi:nucleoside-diphosphate-sugar epimerase
MNRVLLTGASGFIGSHCLPRLLDAGYEVHAVAPAGVEPGDPRATWHVADLLDADQMHALLARARPTHLLHLAWFVAPGEYWRSAENVRWVQAGLDLAREFADAGGRRSVMAGTGAEYAASAELVVEGVTPLRPTTLYGACKAALHLASSAYLSERGVSNAWGHIFYLYGPGENPARLVPSVIRALRAGERFECLHPNDVRDFLRVEDVASAFVALLDSDVEGDVNIASGEPTTVGDLVTAVAEALGRPDLADCRSAEPEASRQVGDNTRLRREVGWARRWARGGALESCIAWLDNRPGEEEGGVPDAMPSM